MNLNIIGENVKTIHDIQCHDCDFTGTITYDAPRVTKLVVGGELKYNTLCPKCKKSNVFAHGGTFIRDDATCRMNRQDDAGSSKV